MKKIIFFNAFHNGDIHVSRSFIKKIVEANPNISFIYSHRNPKLLKDINLVEDPNYFRIIGERYKEEAFEINGDLYLNTWYASGNYKYMNTHGVTFDCLYELFSNHFKRFGMDIENYKIEDLYPEIDYEKYNIGKAREYLSDKTCKKIMIINADAKSGQSVNFPMNTMINYFSKKYPEKLFFVTNNFVGNADNIVYTKDVIGPTPGSDLNEIAYISTHCDVIIGRATGPHAFAVNKTNAFDRKIDIIAFSDLTNDKFWIGNSLKDKINYSSNILNFNIGNEAKAIEIVEKYI